MVKNVIAITSSDILELPSGQQVKVKEDGPNFSVHFLKAGPMKLTGVWLPGNERDVEIDLEKAQP